MTTAPATTQAAGRAAVVLAVRAFLAVRRIVGRAIDFAGGMGVPSDEIWGLCREHGLDDFEVRALLEVQP